MQGTFRPGWVRQDAPCEFDADVTIHGTLRAASLAGSPSVDGDLTVGSLTTGGLSLGADVCGTADLVAGTVDVDTTAVTGSSLIFLTGQADNGGDPGALSATDRTAGTSFTITSSSATDTSTVAWLIVEPS